MQPSVDWSLRPLADMSSAEFHDWQALLEERSGMVVTEQRRAFLQANLSSRMREVGVADYASYYRQVTDGPRGAVEWSSLMDRLTVQETRFFRHPPSFALLSRYMQQRCDVRNDAQPWSLWSVGCASGEETYSLAICAAEALTRSGDEAQYGVIGTDISLSALARSRDGFYSHRRLEHLASDLRERYFQLLPDDRFQVLPGLAARVCFARLNVLELAGAPMSNMDVIFCQNLLIYFRRWRRREILNRLAERLAPGGLLVIGAGEVVGWQHPELVPVADSQVLAFTRKCL
ncbi:MULTISPECIES: CheR family methyltransferase [Pseudomonadaceae]|uniref:CheR family methyltransferase n=1 Tax=Pseudomonadaceae TaxID=135621 RepID=UPI00103D8718|nr:MULTISPECIES: CheR family methyltransferase [Pseudomonadaceae]MBA1276499.1 protein-glutamate O-methyltransferase CheR [Stutzerimonas stutzeri]MBC8649007.1 protein-glutamate O-methyltransferase CheR [Pseudomonas sp. MT4]QXY92968.1 protein-glutamate O-methyltransferase CheR [Pseudomonas sp. MTM4]TCD22635.1 protein-glutamate O-methyltransferase CheR [Pseudomonas sp. IC_126]